MLKVSYCDRSMSFVCHASCVVRRALSVVRRQQFALKPKCTTPTPLGKLTRNLVGSIGVTPKQKKKKKLKSFRSEIHDGSHLENLFFAYSPETKGQLTRNLVGSIGVTCKSKIAKTIPIRNPRFLKISFSLPPEP